MVSKRVRFPLTFTWGCLWGRETSDDPEANIVAAYTCCGCHRCMRHDSAACKQIRFTMGNGYNIDNTKPQRASCLLQLRSRQLQVPRVDLRVDMLLGRYRNRMAKS